MSNELMTPEDDFDPVWEFRVLFDGYDDEMVMDCLTGLCEGVIRANMIWFTKAGADSPCCLSNAGVTYIPPVGCGSPHPCQTVLCAPEIIERKKATCIDIACYVGALLRLRGVPATVVFTNMLDSQNLPIEGQYHALVETPDGVLDYTQDLIDGNTGACSADCRRPIMDAQTAGAY